MVSVMRKGLKWLATQKKMLLKTFREWLEKYIVLPKLALHNMDNIVIFGNYERRLYFTLSVLSSCPNDLMLSPFSLFNQNGDGYVDTKAKMQRILDAISSANGTA